MTADAVIRGTARKLKELWPGKKVWVDEVPRDADGGFFVALNNPAQQAELAGRRRRTGTVNITYFTKERDNMAYHAWAETMFQNFDYLLAGGQLYHCKALHAEQVGRDYHFIFDVDIGLFFADPPGEKMGALQQEGGIKRG